MTATQRISTFPLYQQYSTKNFEKNPFTLVQKLKYTETNFKCAILYKENYKTFL